MRGSIAIQVLPAVNRDEVFETVDKVIEYIDSTGFNYHVGPFETTVEGSFEELMDLIKKCHEVIFESEIVGVSTYIKTSFTKKEGFWSIDEKIKKYNK